MTSLSYIYTKFPYVLFVPQLSVNAGLLLFTASQFLFLSHFRRVLLRQFWRELYHHYSSSFVFSILISSPSNYLRVHYQYFVFSVFSTLPYFALVYKTCVKTVRSKAVILTVLMIHNLLNLVKFL